MTQSMARALKRSNPKIRRRSISIPNMGYRVLVFGVPDSHAQTVGRTRLRRQYTNKLNPNALNVQTFTVGITYGIDFTDIRFGLNTGYDFSMSSSQFSHYDAHGLSVGLHYRIMQKEKLNWNINYNGYVSYNIQKDEGVDNDFSLSNSIGSSFNYKKHTASMYLSLSNYSDMERIGQRVHTNLDTRFTLSYSYSFAARVIKKKTKQQRAEEKVSRHAKKMQKNAS